MSGKFCGGFCLRAAFCIRAVDAAVCRACEIIAVRYRAVAISNHAADITTAADIARVIAICHRAAVISNHAADSLTAADIARVIAARHRAAVVYSNYAADTTAADRAVHTEVLHRAAFADISEQALIVACAIDIQSAYFVPAAVKIAGEWDDSISNGRP